ncbi:hypothetical protein DAH22_28065, partial [Escherichia coli]
EGWAILLRQKQKKLIMLPSETMIWQPEFTDKTLSRKPGAVHYSAHHLRESTIKLCAQIADNPLIYCLQSKGIRYGFIYISWRWFESAAGYIAKQPDHR